MTDPDAPSSSTQRRETSAIPTRFVTRIGLAIARPARALAIAGGRRYPGRSGSDLIGMLLLVLAATQLRGLVGALWLGVAVDFGLGVRAAIQLLTRALTFDLAFLVIAAVLLWLVAGRRRDLGRAFDVACVVALPLVFVELAAGVVERALDIRPAPEVGWAIAIAGMLWALGLLIVAIGIVRGGPTRAAPTDGLAVATWPGRLVIVAVLAGVVLHGVWIVRNVDLMRPVTHGDPAPELQLPTIVDAGGDLGPTQTLGSRRGKIVVIDFWATWCKPCLQAMPHLDRLAASAPDVEVLAVNLDDPAAAFALFRDAGYRMTLLADDGDTSERYGVSTIPHTVLIDRDGTVREVYRGAHDIAREVEQIRK